MCYYSSFIFGECVFFVVSSVIECLFIRCCLFGVILLLSMSWLRVVRFVVDSESFVMFIGVLFLFFI